ncbi:4-hydroxy-tetrahydrodipicolinate reductase [Pseudobacteriovorax antillogorgiicola]|uniref:4-hydroxy-tetrahydrodipicolinate reductase n=1 Tax=Pseudobacteriovorax antillogorgiicola TaxID=1513793 RepID=A0A1Y6B3V8_9BACT|nr:4-hydroxy-tetrahydrodipicolinate reductase [Pseudobacteriovorax antillogorgiicola]TCS59231.1 dihydrodipicolinate reductase [Pseudobacteriovorax antillogorgiicola]SME90303.1 dihydrodipicolinate reductase [Pseudobacteriovorax antillogorgiicola]
MTKVWLHGYHGRMGQEILHLLEEDSHLKFLGGSSRNQLILPGREPNGYSPNDLVESLGETDVIIDFSNIAGNQAIFKACKTHKLEPKAFVIGTTGLDRGARNAWKDLCREAGHRLLFAPNTSLGVLLTMKMSQQMAQVLSPMGFDIEIIESHHRNKVDSPSGTAMFLADRICDKVDLKVSTHRTGKREANELGVFALRGGSVFGEHEVRFMGDHEELAISHRALSRTLFAKGALLLAKWIQKQKPGQHYGLPDVDLNDLA